MKHHAKLRQKSVAYSYLARCDSIDIDPEKEDDDFNVDEGFRFMDDYVDQKLVRMRSPHSNSSITSTTRSTSLPLRLRSTPSESLQTSPDFEAIRSAKMKLETVRDDQLAYS